MLAYINNRVEGEDAPREGEIYITAKEIKTILGTRNQGMEKVPDRKTFRIKRKLMQNDSWWLGRYLPEESKCWRFEMAA